LIDVCNLFGFSLVENNPDDEVDDGKLWDELKDESPVEREPTG